MARTAVTKPTPTDHEWAEAAAGADIVTPADAQIESGYHAPPAQIPKLEEINHWFQKFDRAVRYYIERGLPDWDAAETYQKGDIVRYNPGGVFSGFYVAVVTSPTVALIPPTNETLLSRQWERWEVSPYGGPDTDTTNNRVRTWRNANGFPGAEIDRLGYLSGSRAYVADEMWRGSDLINTTGTSTFNATNLQWAAALTAGNADGQILVEGPAISPTRRARNVAFQLGTGASDSNTLLGNALVRYEANQISMEWRVVTDAAVDKQRIAMGLGSTAGNLFGDASSFVGAIFFKANANANWHCITGDGSTLGTDTDTGVACAASTEYFMRIEYIDASLSSGGVTQCRFYINDTLIAGTSTTHLPSGAAAPVCAPILGTKRDTASGAIRQFYVTPVRLRAFY